MVIWHPVSLWKKLMGGLHNIYIYICIEKHLTHIAQHGTFQAGNIKHKQFIEYDVVKSMIYSAKYYQELTMSTRVGPLPSAIGFHWWSCRRPQSARCNRKHEAWIVVDDDDDEHTDESKKQLYMIAMRFTYIYFARDQKVGSPQKKDSSCSPCWQPQRRPSRLGHCGRLQLRHLDTQNAFGFWSCTHWCVEV